MKKGLSKKLACLVTLITVTSNTVAFAQDINKDETVYVILDENGNPTEQIVSDWIKGSENLGKFSDKSTLTEILKFPFCPNTSFGLTFFPLNS